MATYKEYEVVAEGDRAGMVISEPLDGIFDKLIVHVHGVDEKGDGSDKALDLIRSRTPLTLEQGATGNGFLLAAVQTKDNGQFNEVNEAREWALAKYPQINPKKVYLTGLSNGGGVVNRYLAENLDAHEKFAAAAPMCAGWNRYFFPRLEAQFAKTKVPYWAFHAADDGILKPIESTVPNVKAIQAAGGNAAMTIHNTGGHYGGWQAYGFSKPGQVPANMANATEFNNVGCNLYEWFDANEIGKDAVMPWKPGQKPQPPVVIPPPNEEKPIEEKVFVESFNLAGGEITIAWADGVVDVFKPEKGDRIRGLFGRCNKAGVVLRYTIDFEKGTPQVIQNPRVNTPAVA